jgi:Zn-dependent M28 family amino/carboxypeptidase
MLGSACCGMRKRLLVLGCSLLLVVCAGTQVFATSLMDLVNQVSQDQYTSYLQTSLYTSTGNNRGLGGTQHDLAQTNIYNAFSGFGLTTSLDPFTYNTSTYYNVVGLKPGTTNPTSYYIVGAHYDSVNNPGADDDASGVAAVMEAARVLSPYQFAYSILFIAFDREEQGLIGSTAYANAHAADNILGMVELDMIAYNPAGNNHDKARIYGTEIPNPVMTGLATALTTYGGITYSFEGVLDHSDHAPFKNTGKDAALLIEYEVFNNPYYHTAGDSIDTLNYLDYVYATNMTRGTVGWLAGSATLVPLPDSLSLFALGILALLWRGYYTGRQGLSRQGASQE